MQISLYLKQDPIDGHPACPMIKTALPLPHSHLVARSINSNIRTNSRIQPVPLPT